VSFLSLPLPVALDVSIKPLVSSQFMLKNTYFLIPGSGKDEDFVPYFPSNLEQLVMIG
jgi:hypothetical protein